MPESGILGYCYKEKCDIRIIIFVDGVSHPFL